jgi:DNA-binding transcriptional LysR family regulator
VVISRRGQADNIVDERLRELGLTRRVALTVPTVAVALATVAATGLVTTVPGLLAAGLDLALTSRPLPLRTPEIPAVMAWHSRHDRDAAHHWLRSEIAQALAAIARPGTTA